MAQLTFSSVRKQFDQKTVLQDVSLDIKDGELLALLGPSGCGKTTMLRLIAGFETPDRGSLHKDQICLAGDHDFVPPEKRNMGIVFQSYALWPHMNVRENVAYPLQVRKLPKQEQKELVDQALEIVELLEYADRSPASLSGGQRQRVALARCLVMSPDAILLDEPLANLDAHLREVMQQTFLNFHQKSQATMIYVTHDQAEAMAMADRIAVMFDGEIVQIATPEQLYHCPQDQRVAGFIGQAALLKCRLQKMRSEQICQLRLGKYRFVGSMAEPIREGQDVLVCVRPENVKIGSFLAEKQEKTHEKTILPAIVSSATYLGERFKIDLSLPCGGHLSAYHQTRLQPGCEIFVKIDHGWVLPVQPE